MKAEYTFIPSLLHLLILYSQRPVNYALNIKWILFFLLYISYLLVPSQKWSMDI